MRVHLGDWWTRDNAGKTTAHCVGAVFPDLRSEAAGDGRPGLRVMLDCDSSYWIPLCECGTPAPASGRREYAALFSTFMPWNDHERCSACEILSPLFDSWIRDGESKRSK